MNVEADGCVKRLSPARIYEDQMASFGSFALLVALALAGYNLLAERWRCG